MTSAEGRSLRVALLDDPAEAGRPPEALATGLRSAGHEVSVIEARPVGVIEELLRRRGFADRLTPVPFAAAALLRGDFDLAHAFSSAAALSALAWRRLGPRRRVVFTARESVDRAALADRRLRLWRLERALESDAVIAGTDEVRRAFQRWLALDVPVIAPDDSAAYERLYRELVARRG